MRDPSFLNFIKMSIEPQGLEMVSSRITVHYITDNHERARTPPSPPRVLRHQGRERRMRRLSRIVEKGRGSEMRNWTHGLNA